MNSKIRLHYVLAAISCVFVAAALVSAVGPDDKERVAGKQPDKNSHRESRGGDPESDRKVLRERLARRLAEAKSMEARLQAALDRLDKGEPSSQVMKDVEFTRGDRPDRPEARGENKEPSKPLTPDERTQLLNFMREHLPRAAARLEPEQAEATDRVLTRFAPRVREVIALKQSDPRLFSLRVDEMRAGFDVMSNCRDLSIAIRNNKDEDVTAIETAIKDATGRRFDALLAAQRLEADGLGSRMEQLKTEIDRKLANRDSAVAEEAAKTIERARKFELTPPRNNREPKAPDHQREPSGSR